MHFKVPFMQVSDAVETSMSHYSRVSPLEQFPHFIDCRDIPRVISSTTGTKDLQMVNISLRVLSRPDLAHLAEIYKTLGADFNDRVLPSIGNEILKNVVAQYNAEQLLTEREKVSKEIQEVCGVMFDSQASV
jgi:prohibitin 1